MYTVILYYKIAPIDNPKREVIDQLKLCNDLNLKGRVIISDYGINGTLGGDREAIERYVEYTNDHPELGGIDFKFSESSAEPFAKLRIVARNEIITTGVKEKIDFTKRGRHVDCDTFHKWLQEGQDMVLLDLRNDYEWEIGRFKGAIKPPLKYFRDLEKTAEFYRQFKGKKIVMYCTGGIRCEPASAFLINEILGEDNVYQLEGGIVKYAEKYGNSGYFEGKCYVFDNRIAVPIDSSPNAVITGKCRHCEAACDVYRNCANSLCNLHFLACENCNEAKINCCGDHCQAIISNVEFIRPPHSNDLKVMHRNK